MKQYRPDPHAKRTLQLLLFLLAGLLVFAVYYVLSSLSMLLTSILSLSICGIAVVLALFVLPLWFRHASYRITDTSITACYGILIRKEKTILLHAVQGSTMIRLPFYRLTGLSFLPLYAYGGYLILMFLHHEDITELNRFLAKKLYPDNETENPS